MTSHDRGRPSSRHSLTVALNTLQYSTPSVTHPIIIKLGDSPVELNLDFGVIVGSDRSQAVAVASAAAADGGGNRVAEDDSSNDGDPYNEGGDSKNGVGIVKMEEESDDDNDDEDDNAEDRSLGRFKTEDDNAKGCLLSQFKTEEDSDHKVNSRGIFK